MTSIGRGGLAAIAGALLAIAGNAAVLAADPAVSEDRISYPLSTQTFQLGQIFFAVTQALMAWGIVALVRTGIAGPGRPARVAGWLAVTGMALTVPGELALIPVASADVDSNASLAASTVFGLGVLLADIGLVTFGVLALRLRRWPAAWAALPLAFGFFQLLVVTPVSFALGFASIGSFVVISLADVMIALIGVRLVRGPNVFVSREAARSQPA